MIIDYQPRGVCSRRMTLEVEEGVIRSIRIHSEPGCQIIPSASRAGATVTCRVSPA